MLKKVLSAALGICLTLSVMAVPISVGSVAAEKTAPVVESPSADGTGYVDYQNQYKSYAPAAGEITCSVSGVHGSASIESDGIVINKNGSASFNITVPADGWYEPRFTYLALPGNGNDIELELRVDGKVPFSQARNFLLYRLWKNASDEISKDKYGNEYSPEQVEASEWQTSQLRDSDGFIIYPLCLALKSGRHTVTLTAAGEPVKIGKIVLTSPESVPSYKDYAAHYDAGKTYAGDPLTTEGESAVYKSQKMFIPQANRNDVAVTPANPMLTTMNFIGGSNWSHGGGTITWNINAPEDGFYRLGFHFRQNYVQEGNSYRTLMIDGKIPFEEARTVAFPYKSGWQFMNLKSGDEDSLVYLSKGPHTLSLTVTLGDLCDLSADIQEVTNRIGKIYREIVKITGEKPDANRDYNLYTAIPDLEERLEQISKDLDKLMKLSDEIAGASGGTNTQTIRKVSITVNQMLEKKFQAHTRLGAFYDNYASLCSWLYEMQSMALDIDSITLSSPKEEYNGAHVGFFERIGFSLKRLYSSFLDERSDDDDDAIVLWSNWGRDQLNVLENLITNDFTPKTGIKVNIKITAASLIQANLSGKGPDVEINLARTDPLNYAMRGILTDLSQFDDFEEVMGRFSKTAGIPYQYKGGTYGLPNTETFNMLFIRQDIFEELGISIPKTWDEFINVAKIISLNNMESGMTGDALYMFMLQRGASLYTDDLSATTLTDSKTVAAAKFWTDFYTKYSFPISYSFFNRFRTGLMPMAIAPYTEYATLKAAAPEINGKWIMAEVPGTVQEDGSVNNVVQGGGTANVILKWSNKKDKAWEFLKWWTSDDIQYRFGTNIESVLGVSGRYPTANLKANSMFGWDTDSLEALNTQFTKLVNIPEVPGSYFVGRSVNQVYWNVVNAGANVEDMLNKWAPEADDEIRRKTEEYANK